MENQDEYYYLYFLNVYNKSKRANLAQVISRTPSIKMMQREIATSAISKIHQLFWASFRWGKLRIYPQFKYNINENSDTSEKFSIWINDSFFIICSKTQPEKFARMKSSELTEDPDFIDLSIKEFIYHNINQNFDLSTN